MVEREVSGVDAGDEARPVRGGQGLSWLLSPVVLLALVCGLGLRLWFVFRYAHVTGDALMYADLAHNLLVHGVYGLSQHGDGGAAGVPHATLIRLPGYPLFVALCFRVFGLDRYTAVLGVQVAADLWTCLLLGGMAGRMFGRRAGTGAVWLAALCPFTANYVAAPLTETMTLFSMTLAFYALLRWREGMRQGRWRNRWLYGIALGLGYGILLRPEQGLVAAAVIPAMFWVGLGEGRGVWRAARPVVWAAVLTVLPLVPWTVRNWRTFHVVEPLAPRFANDPGEAVPYGFQRWYRTWAIDFASTDEVYWAYDGAPVTLASLPARAFDSAAQYSETEALLADYNEEQNPTPELDRRFAALAEERVRAQPARFYLELPTARLMNMVLRPRTEMLPVPLRWWGYRAQPRATVFALGYAALNLGYLVLAGMGLARRRVWRRDAVMLWTLLATVGLRAGLLLTLDNSEPRYTLEFFPVLIVLGAVVFAGWGRMRIEDPSV